MAHFRQVLTLLWNAAVTLYMNSCSFFAETTHLFGRIIQQYRQEILELIPAAVGKLRNPTTQTKQRSFLGFCNVIRGPATNLSKVAAPLHIATKRSAYVVPLP